MPSLAVSAQNQDLQKMIHEIRGSHEITEIQIQVFWTVTRTLKTPLGLI